MAIGWLTASISHSQATQEKLSVFASIDATQYADRPSPTNAVLGVTEAISFKILTPAITLTQDTPLLKALGCCCYWQHLLDTGLVADTVEIATREGLGKVTVNETLRLAPLAPDIAEAILHGTLPWTVSRQLLLRITRCRRIEISRGS